MSRFSLSLPSKMSMNLSASFLNSLTAEEKPIVAVRIFPNALDTSVVRDPKHLAVLLDASGSMQGERMESVKRTLHLLADTLPVGEILTVIQYSSTSTVPLDAVKIDVDRSAIHAVVNDLYADGGTNLESALFKLREVMAKTPVDGVFLLTDGHINEGVTSGTGLLRILGADAPALNTLGYGVDYNSRTLKHLSVNTRGSHTFADAAELIPAIIGDIIGGLASEVATQAKLMVPPGWRCLELGYEEGDAYYKVGTLIAEKDQWVVLEGPVNTTTAPALSLSWKCGQVEHTTNIQIDEANSKESVCEQLNRTQVTAVFGRVTDLLEEGDVVGATAALTTLSQNLNSSLAKDRPFVIRLMAQVDEMLEELQKPYMRYNRMNAVSSGLVPRMVSNQVSMGVQRGIVSRLQSVQPPTQSQDDDDSVYAGGPPPPVPVGRALTGVLDSFSSPAQRMTSGGMANRYSQQQEDSHSAYPPPPVPLNYMTSFPARQ